MVDPVGSYSQIQKITSSVSKIQKEEGSEQVSPSGPVDEVTISDEAAFLALASNTSSLISANNDTTLSGSIKQLEELA